MDEWMDGWMVGQTDGWMSGRMDGWIYVYIYFDVGMSNRFVPRGSHCQESSVLIENVVQLKV